jgi:hypothetical protein
MKKKVLMMVNYIANKKTSESNLCLFNYLIFAINIGHVHREMAKNTQIV